VTEESDRSCIARVTTMPFEVRGRLTDEGTAARIASWLAEERALDADGTALGDELYRLAGPADGAPSSAESARGIRRWPSASPRTSRAWSAIGSTAICSRRRSRPTSRTRSAR